MRLKSQGLWLKPRFDLLEEQTLIHYKPYKLYLIRFPMVLLQACLSAIENRGVKIGKAMYRELTGLKKPMLDKNNILHWPVLLLYAEAMTSDFVEDFCETDMFATHLDMISFFQFPFQSLFLFLHLISITSVRYILCPSLAL